jgi:hypothetical protein
MTLMAAIANQYNRAGGPDRETGMTSNQDTHLGLVSSHFRRLVLHVIQPNSYEFLSQTLLGHPVGEGPYHFGSWIVSVADPRMN